MKYYIVALFDKESYEILTPLQKKISKKYRANRRSPIPHIALDIIETSNIEKVTPVMEKVLKPYKRFKIEYKDNISVSDTLRTINIKVQDRGYIKKIYQSLTDYFELNGVNVKFTPNRDIGISLASINHFHKDKINPNSEVSCDSNDNEKINTLKIDRLEIWKIGSNKKELCLKSFPLKAF